MSLMVVRSPVAACVHFEITNNATVYLCHLVHFSGFDCEQPFWTTTVLEQKLNFFHILENNEQEQTELTEILLARFGLPLQHFKPMYHVGQSRPCLVETDLPPCCPKPRVLRSQEKMCSPRGVV